MSKLCVIGRGFIGSALTEELINRGHEVSFFPLPDTEIVFLFGGPTHPDYDKNPEYWNGSGIYNRIKIYCETKNVKLIYASSALVYEPEKPFGKYMLGLESLMGKNTLGLRIFPVYGLGGHSVIEEWEKDLIEGRRPIIWGNGKQTRDFIHIDDVVEQIISVMGATGIVDIGMGESKTFNEWYSETQEWLDIYKKPKYIKAPKGYQINGVVCKYPLNGKR